MIPVKSTIAPKVNAAKFSINKSATPKSADRFAQKTAAPKPASTKAEESKVKVIDDDEDGDGDEAAPAKL